MLKSKWFRYLVIGAVVVVGGILLSAFIASGPFSESEFEKPIERKTRWIEVKGEPFELPVNYVAEGQNITLHFDFEDEPGEDYYVSYIMVYLIWYDDARTDLVVLPSEQEKDRPATLLLSR